MRVVSFAAAAAVITGVFSLIAYAQGRGDVRDFADGEAVRVARGVAWVYRQSPEAAQQMVETLPLARSALVVKGSKIAVHSSPERAGQSLSQDSLDDKALYDTAQLLKANARKNAEERERNPALDRDAYPEVEIRELDPSIAGPVIAAAVAVKEEDRFLAMARAEVSVPPLRPGYPLEILLAGIGAVLLFALVSRKVPNGGATLGLGLVLLVATSALDVRTLAGWRDELRRASARASASTLAGLARAGLLMGEPAAPPELTTLLSLDARGAASGGVAAVRSSTIAADMLPGAWRVDSAPYEVWFSDARFTAAHQQDRSDLFRWALFATAIAGALFVLGTLGRLHAFGRAVVHHRTAYGYLFPAMLGMAVLVFIPVVFGIVLGFTDRRYNVFEFAGLANYIAILSDFDVTSTKNFYFKLGVTLLWTGANIALHVGIGLFMALLLNDEMLKAKGIYRVLLVVPWAVPNYITALIWKGMFHKQFGAVNFALDALGMEPVAWFGSFWPAFVTNLSTNTWLGFPFMMVVSLGALQSIPTDLYEAAFVDGASRWQRFKDITLPLLMPALVPAVIMGTVWTFNMFNIIYLVSGGAPDGATDILITDAFRWAFERDRYGYAAAYSTIIFVILLFFTLITNRITGATKGAFE